MVGIVGTGREGFEPSVQVLALQRFSNCRLSCDALQSQLLTIALRHQNSPDVTSVVSYGTLFGTLIS